MDMAAVKWCDCVSAMIWWNNIDIESISMTHGFYDFTQLKSRITISFHFILCVCVYESISFARFHFSVFIWPNFPHHFCVNPRPDSDLENVTSMLSLYMYTLTHILFSPLNRMCALTVDLIYMFVIHSFLLRISCRLLLTLLQRHKQLHIGNQQLASVESNWRSGTTHNEQARLLFDCRRLRNFSSAFRENWFEYVTDTFERFKLFPFRMCSWFFALSLSLSHSFSLVLLNFDGNRETFMLNEL